MWGENELKVIIERNDPKIIFTIDQQKEKDFIQIIKNSISDLTILGNRVSSSKVKNLKHIIFISDKKKEYNGLINYDQIINNVTNYNKELMKRLNNSMPTDAQLLFQTSGTTGVSKSVLLDHRTPLLTVNHGAKNLGYKESDKYINFSPFFHVGGIFAINLNLVFAGTSLYLLDPFSPIEALRLIDENNITATFGFAAHLQAIYQQMEDSNYSFKIKKLILAADPKTYDMVSKMGKQNDIKISMMYGQSEHSGLAAMTEYDCIDPKLRKYTNGVGLPGVQIKITDLNSGERLIDGQAGEICIKSPLLFKGYYKEEFKTKNAFDDEGFFHTDDYGMMENGYLYFLGRLGGVIKSGGENVSTYRVNLQLLELFPDKIEDIQSVGIPDDYWGTKLVSWVRKKDGVDNFTVDELKKRAKGKLSDYEIPKELLFWNGEWPMSAEGKTNLKWLTEKAVNLLNKKTVN